VCDKTAEFPNVTADGKHIYCWPLQRYEITSVTSQISLDTINLCETPEHAEYTGGNATHQRRCSASPRHLGFHAFTISYHLISSSHTACFGSNTAVSYCLRSHFSFFPIHISYFGLSLCIRVIPLCVMTKCTTTNTAYLLDVAAATYFGLICTYPLSY
jgi:hypothetical protein